MAWWSQRALGWGSWLNNPRAVWPRTILSIFFSIRKMKNQTSLTKRACKDQVKYLSVCPESKYFGQVQLPWGLVAVLFLFSVPLQKALELDPILLLLSFLAGAKEWGHVTEVYFFLSLSQIFSISSVIFYFPPVWGNQAHYFISVSSPLFLHFFFLVYTWMSPVSSVIFTNNYFLLLFCHHIDNVTLW